MKRRLSEDVADIYEIVLQEDDAIIPSDCVLTSQLAALNKNKSILVETLSSLRQTCKYRFLSCSFAGVKDDVVMKTEDYLHSLIEWKQSAPMERNSLFDKFSRWINVCPSISIFSDDLKGGWKPDVDESKKDSESDELALTSREIEMLVEIGYLRKRRDVVTNDIYWFSHPQLGALLSNVLESRKQIVAFIKLRRYKEIPTTELYQRAGQTLLIPGLVVQAHDSESGSKRRKASDSSLAHGAKMGIVKSLKCTGVQGLFYHITDLVGCDLLVRVPTPAGEILRLNKQ